MKAEKLNIFFKPIKVQINPNTPHLADIKPSRYENIFFYIFLKNHTFIHFYCAIHTVHTVYYCDKLVGVILMSSVCVEVNEWTLPGTVDLSLTLFTFYSVRDIYEMLWFSNYYLSKILKNLLHKFFYWVNTAPKHLKNKTNTFIKCVVILHSLFFFVFLIQLQSLWSTENRWTTPWLLAGRLKKTNKLD